MRAARAAGTLTAWGEQRFEFREHGFFGRLRIDVEPGRSRAWFPEENPDTTAWEGQSIEYLGGDLFRVRAAKVTPGQVAVHEVRLDADGQCYSVDVPQVGIREWFCREQ